jgi:hypothetical protein
MPSGSTTIQQDSQPRYSTQTPLRSQLPWNPHDVYFNSFRAEVGAGVGAFGPEPGIGYEAFITREPILDPSLSRLRFVDPRTALSVSSGYSRPLTIREVSSTEDEESSPEPIESRSHVFSFVPGMGISTGRHNRVRKLSPEKRKQTLAVRKDGACWACHLSKIKVCRFLMALTLPALTYQYSVPHAQAARHASNVRDFMERGDPVNYPASTTPSSPFAHF